jgi:hypothetical protein
LVEWGLENYQQNRCCGEFRYLHLSPLSPEGKVKLNLQAAGEPKMTEDSPSRKIGKILDTVASLPKRLAEAIHDEMSGCTRSPMKEVLIHDIPDEIRKELDRKIQKIAERKALNYQGRRIVVTEASHDIPIPDDLRRELERRELKRMDSSTTVETPKYIPRFVDDQLAQKANAMRRNKDNR